MDGGADRRPLPRPTLVELAAIGVLTLLGLRLGLRSIGDNSMLLHIRTGIDIVSSGHIPRHDPYTFTAPGHAWVVQSWLAEVSYGVAHWLGGYRAIVLEQGFLTGLLALLVAVLARTGRSIGTVVAAGVSVFAGALLWSPRPFMFGLLGLALLLFIVERRHSPWWLVPVVWVWVNTHGSFPLGLAWLAATYVGSIIDERRRPRWLDRYVVAFVAGLAVSAINPLGPRLLAFPLVIQGRQQVFKQIIEWRSPNFQEGFAFVSLLAICIALLVLLRRGAPWSDILPVVGFLASALIAQRNLPFAAVVLAPALARAFQVRTVKARGGEAVEPPDAEAARGPHSLPPPIVPALVIAGVVLVAQSFGSSPLDLGNYPTGAERYLELHGLLTAAHRIATQDTVGDYRELAEGAHRSVFIDDRYDMFPVSVVNDSQAIAAGQGGALEPLRRRNIDIVVWRKNAGPTALLHIVGGWRVAWSDAGWEILVRDPSVAPSPQK